MRHADAHLSRRLGHVDRTHSLDHQLMIIVGYLYRPHLHIPCPPTDPETTRGCPGASVEGTEILTGVLEATVRDPSRSSPGAKLMDGLTHPRMGRRRRATRPNFHACEAYARTECSWQNGGPITLAGDKNAEIDHAKVRKTTRNDLR